MGGMKDEGATGPRDCRIRCVDTNNHQTIKTSHHPLLPLSSLTKKTIYHPTQPLLYSHSPRLPKLEKNILAHQKHEEKATRRPPLLPV